MLFDCKGGYSWARQFQEPSSLGAEKQPNMSWDDVDLRWTPHPVIATIGDNNDYIILYHHYRVGGPPNVDPWFINHLSLRALLLGSL